MMNSLTLNTLNSWTYKTMGISMDGGSLTLFFDDLNGHEKHLLFSQHINLKFYKGLNDKFPGRIYSNDVLVEKRSKEESNIIKHLEENLINQLDRNQAELLLKHIDFIKSQKYLINIPVNQHLTETRKNYITSIDNQLRFELNRIEYKYNELYDGKISIQDFENWVYNNERIIIEEYSQSVYDSLIILNYNSKHAKIEVKEILKINLRKHGLTSLKKHLDRLANSDQNISDVNCADSWDYRNYWFSFIFDNIHIGLTNPFKLVNYHHSVDNQKRIDEFIHRFQNPAFFFALINSELNTENVRLVVYEEIEEMQPKDMNEGYFGTQEEIYIQIEEHRVIMNREFVKTKMIEYWQ